MNSIAQCFLMYSKGHTDNASWEWEKLLYWKTLQLPYATSLNLSRARSFSIFLNSNIVSIYLPIKLYPFKYIPSKCGILCTWHTPIVFLCLSISMLLPFFSKIFLAFIHHFHPPFLTSNFSSFYVVKNFNNFFFHTRRFTLTFMSFYLYSASDFLFSFVFILLLF